MWGKDWDKGSKPQRRAPGLRAMKSGSEKLLEEGGETYSSEREEATKGEHTIVPIESQRPRRSCSVAVGMVELKREEGSVDGSRSLRQKRGPKWA